MQRLVSIFAIPQEGNTPGRQHKFLGIFDAWPGRGEVGMKLNDQEWKIRGAIPAVVKIVRVTAAWFVPRAEHTWHLPGCKGAAHTCFKQAPRMHHMAAKNCNRRKEALAGAGPMRSIGCRCISITAVLHYSCTTAVFTLSSLLPLSNRLSKNSNILKRSLGRTHLAGTDTRSSQSKWRVRGS